MILIALGANIAGTQGSPSQTLPWAITELAKHRFLVVSVSSFYCTAAIGQRDQPDYLNAIARVQTSMSAINVLSILKAIEKKAGRATEKLKTEGRWNARSLDLDIVDYKGLVTPNLELVKNKYSTLSDGRCCEQRLVLPHPRAHLRPFVIRPMLDIMPFWHHPVTGLSATSLWARLRRTEEGKVLKRVSG